MKKEEGEREKKAKKKLWSSICSIGYSCVEHEEKNKERENKIQSKPVNHISY